MGDLLIKICFFKTKKLGIITEKAILSTIYSESYFYSFQFQFSIGKQCHVLPSCPHETRTPEPGKATDFETGKQFASHVRAAQPTLCTKKRPS